MATITATITIDFTANYAGAHRVCWRIQGSGDPYDCSTSVSCVGGGTTCQAIITASVNDTSCDGPITFEGYIQAECQDILSTSGRLAWTALFTPVVVCQRQEITCDYAPISAVNITNGGLTYLVGDVINVTRAGGDTQVLNANIEVLTVGDGIINSISALLPGSLGYTAADVLSIVDGIGGSGTITVDTVDGFGEILTYTLTTGGTQYQGPFTFTGGTGTGADFDILDGTDYDAFGKILTVNIIDGGEYSITPSAFTITTALGTGAVLAFTLDRCPAYPAIGTDCDSNPVALAVGTPVGSTFATCIVGAVGVTPSGYSVSAVGCCIPTDTSADVCFDYHLENTTAFGIDVRGTLCDGTFVMTTIPALTITPVCIIEDGIATFNSGLTVTNTGTPCLPS